MPCFGPWLFPYALSAASGPLPYLKKPNAWFAGDDAKRIANNILSHQSDLGGWPKGIDTTAAPYRGNRKNLKPTFDNDATTDELRFLARIYNASKRVENRLDREVGHGSLACLRWNKWWNGPQCVRIIQLDYLPQGSSIEDAALPTKKPPSPRSACEPIGTARAPP